MFVFALVSGSFYSPVGGSGRIVLTCGQEQAGFYSPVGESGWILLTSQWESVDFTLMEAQFLLPCRVEIMSCFFPPQCEENANLQDCARYLNLPVFKTNLSGNNQAVKSSKESFWITSFLCSTKLTQNGTLFSSYWVCQDVCWNISHCIRTL